VEIDRDVFGQVEVGAVVQAGYFEEFGFFVP